MIFMDYYLFDCKILKNFPAKKSCFFENQGFFQLFKSVSMFHSELKIFKNVKMRLLVYFQQLCLSYFFNYCTVKKYKLFSDKKVMSLLGFEPTSFRFKVQIPSWIISFRCPNQDLNPHPSGSNLKVLGSNLVQIPVWSKNGFIHTRIRTLTL